MSETSEPTGERELDLRDATRLAEVTDRHYGERVAKITAGIRRLADEFEREARVHESLGVSIQPRYADAARNGLHAIFWGLANLHADGLASEAGRADQAEAELRQMEDPA